MLVLITLINYMRHSFLYMFLHFDCFGIGLNLCSLHCYSRCNSKEHPQSCWYTVKRTNSFIPSFIFNNNFNYILNTSIQSQQLLCSTRANSIRPRQNIIYSLGTNQCSILKCSNLNEKIFLIVNQNTQKLELLSSHILLVINLTPSDQATTLIYTFYSKRLQYRLCCQ